jgi:uncharacterized protein YcbX
MNLIEIHRYPVKSMGGHTMAEADLGEWGIPGDRAWAVKDEERGGIKAGKRFPSLMAMQANFETEPGAESSPTVQITLPDDQQVRSDDANVNQHLSDAIGSPVTLWPLLPKTQLEHYRRSPTPPGADVEAGLRELFARTPDEPLPDLRGFPPALFEYESPPGTYFDAYPILLMTTGSLDTMKQQTAGSVYDLRRFRPNLVIELPGGFLENEWVGKEIKLGDAVLKVEMPCPRCVMTTHGFRDLPKDPQVMRELVKYNQGNLGVYCNVTTPGKVSLGDILEII